ncbi:MAG: permease, partial [Planctomycetaceae bacterium]
MTQSSPRANPIARLVSLGLLGALLVSLAVLFYQVLSPFLLPLFLAAVLAMLTQPLHRWIATRVGPRPALAAGLT